MNEEALMSIIYALAPALLVALYTGAVVAVTIVVMKRIQKRDKK